MQCDASSSVKCRRLRASEGASPASTEVSYEWFVYDYSVIQVKEETQNRPSIAADAAQRV